MDREPIWTATLMPLMLGFCPSFWKPRNGDLILQSNKQLGHSNNCFYDPAKSSQNTPTLFWWVAFHHPGKPGPHNLLPVTLGKIFLDPSSLFLSWTGSLSQEYSLSLLRSTRKGPGGRNVPDFLGSAKCGSVWCHEWAEWTWPKHYTAPRRDHCCAIHTTMGMRESIFKSGSN